MVAQVPFGLVPRYWDGRMWNTQANAKPYSSRDYAARAASTAQATTGIPASFVKTPTAADVEVLEQEQAEREAFEPTRPTRRK